MILHDPDSAAEDCDMTDEPRTEYRRSALERFIGGSPGGVALRLLFLSLVVGFLMTIFGVDAEQILRSGITLVQDAFRDGAGVFRSLGGYILTGAAIVVPVWLLLRLARAR